MDYLEVLEENKSAPYSYVSLMTTAVLFISLLFFFFCNPNVFGNSDHATPLPTLHLMAHHANSCYNNNDRQLLVAYQRFGYSYLTA